MRISDWSSDVCSSDLRALDPWWNLQAGVRHDFRAGRDRSYAVLGVQGLAPYWFEVDGALFLSDKGDVTARIEAEYDLRLTQKLILRSEEHTSELQSLMRISYAVFCLKKKIINQKQKRKNTN